MPVPLPVPEAPALYFERVSQTGDEPRSSEKVEGLSLSFDAQGIEIAGPRAGQHHSMFWTAVTRVALGRSEPAPDGTAVTPIDVETDGEIARFLLPSGAGRSAQLAALDQHLRIWSGSGPLPHGTASLVVAAVSPPALSPSSQAALPFGVPVPNPWSVVPPTMPVGYSTAPYGSIPTRPKRARRTAMLVIGIVLMVVGLGVAFGLSTANSTRTPAARSIPPLTPDQVLAQRLMLTRADLPPGWEAHTAGSGSGASAKKEHDGEVQITGTFAACMGVSDAQGAVVLGSGGADQTAQSSSPIFVAPSSPQAGFALELQTAAAIVRTHRDEQSDFSLYVNPHYPQCAATAVASELQLGADDSTGGSQEAGPAAVSVVNLPVPTGEQASGLIITFSVSDHAIDVPIQVESVVLGSGRIEANLQAFAIGGPISADALGASVSAFEQRVASHGQSAVA